MDDAKADRTVIYWSLRRARGLERLQPKLNSQVSHGLRMSRAALPAEAGGRLTVFGMLANRFLPKPTLQGWCLLQAASCMVAVIQTIPELPPALVQRPRSNTVRGGRRVCTGMYASRSKGLLLG